jgi:hypothetical protein
LIIGIIVALPFNALMLVAENLIFMIAPTRPASSGPGDFSALGRQIFTLAVRAIGVGVASAIAALAAAIVFTFAGRSLVLATLVAFVILSIEVMALVPLLGYAYKRFDPSMHMPA